MSMREYGSLDRCEQDNTRTPWNHLFHVRCGSRMETLLHKLTGVGRRLTARNAPLSSAFVVTLLLLFPLVGQKLGLEDDFRLKPLLIGWSLHSLASRLVFPQLLVCSAVERSGPETPLPVISEGGQQGPAVMKQTWSDGDQTQFAVQLAAPETESPPNKRIDFYVTIPSFGVGASKPIPAWKGVATGVAGILLATLLTFMLVDAYSGIKRRISKRRAKKHLKDEADFLASYDKDLYSDSFSGNSEADTNKAIGMSSVEAEEDPAKALEDMLKQEAGVQRSD